MAHKKNVAKLPIPWKQKSVSLQNMMSTSWQLHLKRNKLKIMYHISRIHHNDARNKWCTLPKISKSFIFCCGFIATICFIVTYVQFSSKGLQDFWKGYHMDEPFSPSCYQEYLMNSKACICICIQTNTEMGLTEWMIHWLGLMLFLTKEVHIWQPTKKFTCYLWRKHLGTLQWI